MNKYFATLTSIGQSMIAESIRVGTRILLSEMAFGDADYTPSEGQVSLMKERARVSINEINYDENNPAWLRVTAIIPPELGGWNIHEAGIFTDTGNLFAVAKMDGTYKPIYSDGMLKEISLDFVIEIASEAKVELQVDPNAIVATREWVEKTFSPKISGLAELLDDHKKNKSNPHETSAAQVGTYSGEQIDALLRTLLPQGFVGMWSGSANNVPEGWLLCDGKNNTPDMRKKFILGASEDLAVGQSGGAEKHLHNLASAVAAVNVSPAVTVSGSLSVNGRSAGHVLTVDQMPDHKHPITNNRDWATEYPHENIVFGDESKEGVSYTSTGSAGGNQPHDHALNVAATGSLSGTVKVMQSAPVSGSTESADNLPPYYVLAFVMKVWE